MRRERMTAVKIIHMLTDRSGFDGFWDGIDDKIQNEIINEIAEIITPTTQEE